MSAFPGIKFEAEKISVLTVSQCPCILTPQIDHAAVIAGENHEGVVSQSFFVERAGYFTDDPVESFREHVWINPFWEDDISEIIQHMGADRVILGSDWPHMEGLAKPRDILEEVDDIPTAAQEKILYANAVGLNERRPLSKRA